MAPGPNYTYVNWYVPKPLYDALVVLQEGLKGPDGTPKWDTIEAMAVHFLDVAVREAHREMAQKGQQARLVQPAAIVPPMLVKER
mgnify:CR=1 FL=1